MNNLNPFISLNQQCPSMPSLSMDGAGNIVDGICRNFAPFTFSNEMAMTQPKCSNWAFNNMTMGVSDSSAQCESNSNTVNEGLPSEKLHIVDETSLSSVEKGDFVYFAHVNKFTHLAIKKAQEMFGYGNKNVHSVTHVGVVTEANKDSVKVAEINGFGEPISETEYHLKDLFNDEQLLFTSPSKSSRLDSATAELGKQWGNHGNKGNQYNLQGLLSIPLKEAQFNENDKLSLLNNFLDDHFLKRPPHELQGGKLEPKPFFCSEYSLQLEQFVHFKAELGTLPESLNKQMSALNLELPADRLKAITLLQDYAKAENIWDKLSGNPLFKWSSESMSPSSLITAMPQNGRIIRVTNPQAGERFGEVVSKEALPSYLEYATTKIADKALEGQTIQTSDKEVEKLLASLENQGGYSKETLKCFIDKAASTSLDSQNIEECLQTTLGYSEKLVVYFFSREINRALDSLLHHPVFLEFLKHPSKENFEKFDFNSWKLSIETMLETSYPTWEGLIGINLENFILKKLVNQFDATTLIKYLPLSIAYSPPSDTLKAFLEESDIDTVSMALNVHKFISLGKSVVQTKDDHSKLPEVVWKGLASSGFLSKENPATNALSEKLSKQTGYSSETIGCVFDKLGKPELFQDSDIETCIKDNLSIKEKIDIVSTSKVVNQGVENLLENEDFLAFVKQGTPPKHFGQDLNAGHKEDYLLDLLYPSKGGFLQSAENYVAKSFISSSLNQGAAKFILKDVFLGLKYDTPSAPIQKFLEKEKLTKEGLVLRLANFLGFGH